MKKAPGIRGLVIGFSYPYQYILGEGSESSFEDFGFAINTSPAWIILFHDGSPKNNLPSLLFKKSLITLVSINDLNHLWSATFRTFIRYLMRKIPHFILERQIAIFKQ
jgi:hypothetical protein